MDPSIVKLLEEDEDETMHSGADVDAFQAALNRDIGGEGDAPASQPCDSALSQESSQTSSHSFPNWSVTGQQDSANAPSQQDLKTVQHEKHEEKHSVELKPHASIAENQQEQKDVSQEPSHIPLPQKQSQDLQQMKVEQIHHQNPQASGVQMSVKSAVPITDTEKLQNADTESQYLKVQKMSNQQTTGMEQASNVKNPSKQIPFMLLLPALKPHLDKDREMQLQTLFNKLRKNDIAKEQFVRLMRNIVGDQVLKLAVAQLQSQPGSNQSQIQSQVLARQQHVRVPGSTSTSLFTDPSNHPSSSVQVQTDSSYSSAESNAQKSREVERQLDPHGMPISQMPSSSASIVNQERERSSISMQGHNKQHQQQQQQQHLHFPQTSFPMYGSSGGNYNPYPGAKVTTAGSSAKPQPHDVHMRQISHYQSAGATQLGGATQPMNMISVPKFERQISVNDPNRSQSGHIPHYANKSALQQNSVPWQASTNKEPSSTPFSSMNYAKQEPVEQAAELQHKPQLSNPQVLSVSPVEQGSKDECLDKQSSKLGFSTPSGMGPPNSISPSNATQLDPNIQVGSRIPSVASAAGINARTPPKKPSVGQKKPLEALGSSPPTSSKKQKVSGAFLDQSIEQLNDVTAVSGVNLREEEEQLFSGPKDDSRVSEASRRVVQEEEERLILQKPPLQKKLMEIMGKCGLKNISNDVERCLSLCVEERMGGLLRNLIRLSKQRVDAEKPRHRIVLTSDVRQQIMTMNHKAREEWEKKQAEAEKLRKVNEPEGDNGVEGDREKDEGRVKSVKAKEEDDKMRTTAANVAARAAVGGDDMLSKWQLMAEQARQKREGGMEAVSGSQVAKDVNLKPVSTSGRGAKDNHEAEKGSPATPASASAGAIRKFGRNQVTVPHARVARTISVKDVIAVLEREPQMARSTLIYSLYERIRSDAAAD